MQGLENLIANLWKHFGNIAALPHGSGGEDPVREYIYNFASKLNDVKIKWYQKNATDPGQRVIVLQKKPAQRSRFILQGHLDMVCTPPDMKFPLRLIDKDGWRSALDANGIKSTLGADNGIGVAAALALLESDFDGGFECLFTVDEETTMGGAGAFDPGLLDARILFNLDSEELNTITYGSAGGIETYFSMPIAKEKVTGGMAHVELRISGLAGGHSAMCINMGRLNAVKVMAQCLKKLNSKYEFHLISLRGGHAKNAIPHEAVAEVVMAGQDKVGFLDDFDKICLGLEVNNKTVEPEFSHNITQLTDPPDQMMNVESTQKILDFIFSLPHGVIKKDRSMIIISNNLGVVETLDDVFRITCFHRSSFMDELDRITRTLETIGIFFGAEIKHDNYFPLWAPNEDSQILKLVKDVYGKGAITEVTHAGLECGFFYQKYNGDMDCVSIGPAIVDPHSVNEKVNIQSVEVFLGRLIQIINRLK